LPLLAFLGLPFPHAALNELDAGPLERVLDRVQIRGTSAYPNLEIQKHAAAWHTEKPDSASNSATMFSSFQPCLPTRVMKAPTGEHWIHEVKVITGHRQRHYSEAPAAERRGSAPAPHGA
jgi:hypothetical protein